jgi:hypothetical protein
LLTVVYFVGAMTAFALLYWGTHAINTWDQAFLASGSALNTLGFATPTTISGQWLAIPEGALGLGIVVFLFTFIPSYQAAIRSREDQTSWLYHRVGNHPTGIRLLEWLQQAGIANNMREVWEAWEDWFRMLADTHSVSPMLTMSPSVQSGQSWVLAGAAVLDAAVLAASSIETKDVRPLRSASERERVHSWRLLARSATRARLLRRAQPIHLEKSMKQRAAASVVQEFRCGQQPTWKVNGKSSPRCVGNTRRPCSSLRVEHSLCGEPL